MIFSGLFPNLRVSVLVLLTANPGIMRQCGPRHVTSIIDKPTKAHGIPQSEPIGLARAALTHNTNKYENGKKSDNHIEDTNTDTDIDSDTDSDTDTDL